MSQRRGRRRRSGGRVSHQSAAERRPPELRREAGAHGRGHAGLCHGPGPGGRPPIAMVQHAVMAIDVGMCSTVLCVHARKRSTGTPPPAFSSAGATSTGSGPGGTSPPPRATPWPPSATCTSSAPAAKTWRRSPCPPAGTLRVDPNRKEPAPFVAKALALDENLPITGELLGHS